MNILETLEYGYVLTDVQTVVSSKGEVLTLEEYDALLKRSQSNKLDWGPVEDGEVSDLLDRAAWKAKLSEDTDEVTKTKKFLVAVVDSEGTVGLLSFSELFGGASSWKYAETSTRHLAYSVSKNRPDLEEDLTEFVQELYGTTEQVGSEFEADEDTVYRTKKFVKDGTLFALVFKNGVLSNLKEVAKVKGSAEVNPQGSELIDSVANKLANGGFDLL